MRDIALHVLDIMENAVNAGATRIRVEVKTEREGEVLTLEIRDNGNGMDEVTRKRALDPFFTKKPGKRIGLGIPLLAQAARDAGGNLSIESSPGEGTSIRATFALSHPDRKPMGDIQETVELMRAAHPEIDIRLNCEVENEKRKRGEA